MTIEQLWYHSYVDGKPPVATRMSRLPMCQQFDLTIDLAIALCEARAGWRAVGRITKTGEIYYYWPHPLSASKWWLIPERVDKRAGILREKAIEAALRGKATTTEQDAAVVLRRWKRTKTWRKHTVSITPRRTLLPRQKERRKVMDKRVG